MYSSRSCGHRGHITLADSLFNIDQLIQNALQDIYANKSDSNSKALFDITNIALQQATGEGFGRVEWGQPDYTFLEKLQNSNAAFAARKTVHQQRELVQRLVDDGGNLKSFAQFSKDVEPIINDYNRQWLETEYNTAIKRARLAADLHAAENNELYTNVRWLPSRAANPRQSHKVYYNRVFAHSDPTLSLIGSEWGCQCGQELTDDPVTDGNSRLPFVEPEQGLDNNPGISGEIFTQSHPYYKGLSGKEKAAAKRIELNNTYSTVEGGGGFLVHISKGHLKQDLKANRAFAKRLAAADKGDITLLGVWNNQPNYDCYRHSLANEWELKVPKGKSLKSAIQNELKRTKKERFVFEVGKTRNVAQIYQGLLATFVTNKGRAKAVKSIDFLLRDNRLLRFDRSDLVSKESIMNAIKKQLANK